MAATRLVGTLSRAAESVADRVESPFAVRAASEGDWATLNRAAIHTAVATQNSAGKRKQARTVGVEGSSRFIIVRRIKVE